MTALRWIFEFVFECRHRNLGRVFTINNRTYQVCFECGQEVEYSWKLMHSQKSVVVGPVDAPLNPAPSVRLPAA